MSDEQPRLSGPDLTTGVELSSIADGTYRRGGKKLAVATIHRDLAGLRNEVEFERATATRGKPSIATAEAAGAMISGRR